MITHNSYNVPLLLVLALFSFAGRIAGQGLEAVDAAQSSSATVTAMASGEAVRITALITPVLPAAAIQH